MMNGRFSTITNPYVRPDGSLRHNTATAHKPTGTLKFVAVDGEGITLPKTTIGRFATTVDHRYVLLGVGESQIEDSAGLHYLDILDFLYAAHEPLTAFVGYYLAYDFTQWLKTLPENRARALLTADGKERRRSQSPKMHGKFLPVDVGNWQIDMIGSKRFDFRRKECECLTVKCPHEKGPWMYICDAGGFFQTSFLNVINPRNWETPICSDEEYAEIERGKQARSTAALDDDMRYYNRLENRVFARVMADLNTGLQKLDVSLSPKQWFGPGQAAQTWMRGRAHARKDFENDCPEWFREAARASYFGGWFEIQAHGIIPGTSYEYDINSAYPYIISRIPCLLHGEYTQGTGVPVVQENELCLVRGTVWRKPPHSDRRRGNYLGAMLHRDAQGRISRPLITAGWYWWHELNAAIRAGCVVKPRKNQIVEWVKYKPCDCPPPMRQVAYLYQMRLDVGKNSSLGKGAKITSNSIYGKTAQSIGSPQFANPVVASLITAGCRTMILDAIATHPQGMSNVVMVATDAVFFLDPHPLLSDGKGLGEWEGKERRNLTLFKPGVYWDDDARERIKAGEHPNFKARGISAREFAPVIARIDAEFASWGNNPPPVGDELFTPEELAAMKLGTWPRVTFTSGFAMVSTLQALLRNDWASAGAVDTAKPFVQNANPSDKRGDVWLDDSIPGRPIYRSEPHETGSNAVYRHGGNMSEWENIIDESFDSVPYEKRFGAEDPFSDENTQAFGISPDETQIFRGVFRLLSGQE